ncbi:hypothetical protein CBR_g37105 [Chara braunii]|uniref:Protein kinase domain-containing protein n=1 Tax=Chara braunii TaxID=69332 RepID=A0A388LMA5_CHABU|nr:hypothetical protein CBR_g37105 [Chara braunii]|eukprot:GBG83391.1 hypothetical protein CBR_g37105 [Chara braunii]
MWPLRRRLSSASTVGGQETRKGLYLRLKFQERDNLVGEELFDVHPSKPWIASVSAGKPPTLRVWNYEDGHQVAVTLEDAINTYGAKFLGETDKVVVRTDKNMSIYEILPYSAFQMKEIKRVRTWSVTYTDLSKWTVHSSAQSVLHSENENSILILFCDFTTGYNFSMCCTEKIVTMMCFHPFESHIFATVHENWTINVWSADTKTHKTVTLQTLEATGEVTSVRFCTKPQKSLIITGHQSGKLQVWDYQRNECMTTLDAHKQAVVHAFFHPHLPCILSASEDGTIMAWNDSNYQLIKTLCSGLEGLSQSVLCRTDSLLVLPCEQDMCFITVEGVSPEPDFEERGKMEVGHVSAEGDERLQFEKIDVQRIKQLEMELSTVRGEKKALEEGFESERQIHEHKIKELETQLSHVRVERETLGERFERSQLEHERLKGMHSESAKQVEKEKRNLVIERDALKERLKKSNIRVQELECELEMVGGARERSERAVGMPEGVPKLDMHPMAFTEFSLDEMRIATNDFHDDCKLEEQRDGCVYIGKLTSAVIKRLKFINLRAENQPVQVTRELVSLLKSLRHPHLHMLLGVCYEGNCLVYEHMTNGNVKDWMSFSRGSQKGFLPWYIRLRIMAQVAQGLSFLHSQQSQRGGGPIVHRAVKPENILA